METINILMKYRLAQPNSQTKIRSFLSPGAKPTNLSLSNWERCVTDMDEHKTYIEFKRVTRTNGEILSKQLNQKIQLKHFVKSPEPRVTNTLNKAVFTRKGDDGVEGTSFLCQKNQNNEVTLLETIRQLEE